MKLKIAFLMLLGGLGLAACDQPDKVPPRETRYVETYIPPKATPLTQEERNYVDQRREEYNNAIKGQ